MERCANTEALNAYMKRIDENEKEYERQLEFFRSDIESIVEEIQTKVARIKEISRQYDFDLDEQVEEIITDAVWEIL